MRLVLNVVMQNDRVTVDVLLLYIFGIRTLPDTVCEFRLLGLNKYKLESIS